MSLVTKVRVFLFGDKLMRMKIEGTSISFEQKDGIFPRIPEYLRDKEKRFYGIIIPVFACFFTFWCLGG